MPITVKFTQTPELSYDFMSHYRRNNRSFKILIFAVIVLFIVAMVNHFFWKTDSDASLLSVLLPFVFVIGLWYFFIPYFMKKQLVRASQSGGITNEREMVFSAEEIIVKTNVSDAKFAWDGIMKVGESERCYFLYIAKNQALLVPKEAFVNADDKASFLTLLDEKEL